MRRIMMISISTKLLIIIIPLLICSFLISGYISVTSSRKSLSDVSARFASYKSEQIGDYAAVQWRNLQNSSFGGDPVYIEIVEDSVESYVKNNIRKKSEYIFALDDRGSLIFSTFEVHLSDRERAVLLENFPSKGNSMSEFHVSDREFIGLAFELPDFNWKIFLIEDRAAFLAESQILTLKQIFAFGITLILIIFGLIISLTKFTRPLSTMHNAIHEITEKKDFSRKIKIEYPDEIGVLAYDFNIMTTNLDLSYKQLKKYAVDQAIARKEVIVGEKESLQMLGTASDYKDPETGAHITRVSHYSLLLSQSLGQSESIQDLVINSSPLHDIGKLGIPDSILLKPGKLTNEEFAVIKTHTTIGHEILKNSSSKYLKAGAIIALSHHEHYDGTGYPKGLKGEDIPILGRIVSIVDVFDALTTRRPYKEPWSFEKAFEYIYDSRGSQFDPELVELFIKNRWEIKEIYNTNNDFQE